MDKNEIQKEVPIHYSKDELNTYLLDYGHRYLSDEIKEENCPSALIELKGDESTYELHKRLWIANDIIANLIIAGVKKTDISLNKLAVKAVPEINLLYSQIKMKKAELKLKQPDEYKKGITNKLILNTYKEHCGKFTILTKDHLNILCPLTEGREKKDFTIKVLTKIATGDGIESHSMTTNIISILINMYNNSKLK